MPRTFAFLRAINVGGHTVTMARLAKATFRGFGTLQRLAAKYLEA